ncbi:MAG: hypothetical protein HOY79_15910 [Streptomyces sp.]|nr:hypothetical protein [Streptomyces sp.]
MNPQATLLLESLRPNPAYVTSRTLDLLAHNPGALALYAGIEDWPAKQRNLARFMFLHPAARDLYADWDTQLVGCVARLRALAGTDPDAPDLANLIGELLLKSPEFAKRWDRYQVTRSPHTRKPKTFRHPQVGEITLDFQGTRHERCRQPQGNPTRGPERLVPAPPRARARAVRLRSLEVGWLASGAQPDGPTNSRPCDHL